MCDCLEYEDGSMYLCEVCADIYKELLNTAQARDGRCPYKHESGQACPNPWCSDHYGKISRLAGDGNYSP